jgi:hypothetical protein
MTLAFKWQKGQIHDISEGVWREENGKVGAAMLTIEQLSGHFPLTLRQRNPRGMLVECFLPDGFRHFRFCLH